MLSRRRSKLTTMIELTSTTLSLDHRSFLVQPLRKKMIRKDATISCLLALIIFFKLLDLYSDFARSADNHHIAQEMVLIALSLALFIYLGWDIYRRTKKTKFLTLELEQSHQKIEQISKELIESKKKFFEAIQDQFDRWHLSPKERDVALLLIKGYSKSDIANLYSKSQKTIEHQASAAYRKAGVHGRHELVALFFEDLS